MAITITHEHPSRRTALSVVIAAVVAATVIAVAAQITGWRRSRWLLQGAPPFE